VELSEKEEKYLEMLLKEEIGTLEITGEKELVKDVPTIKTILKKLK